ncbi:MAG TPA: hypothetical protein VFX59_22690 [Polyangiales bacterium]|nr:hypothetical protein [Polyangiales bacterium]
MRDQAWLKLLDLICHKLGADDARVEIGGRPPEDPRFVWSPLDDGRRLVVAFGEPLVDAAQAQQRLGNLLASFRETLAIPGEPPPRTPAAGHRELDHALAALAERTGAETIWIIDAQSPVIWGCSESHDDKLDYDALVQATRADRALLETGLSWSELLAAAPAEGYERVARSGLSGAALRVVQDELLVLRELAEQGGLAAAGRRLRSARAVVEIRAQHHDRTSTELRGPLVQCFAHSIANQYQLVLVFDESYSPLHAAGNVQRALPYIEQLLMSLPPVDPSAGAAQRAKVIRLPRRR